MVNFDMKNESCYLLEDFPDYSSNPVLFPSLPRFKFNKHLIKRCGPKVYFNPYFGINQMDLMIFGTCMYWKIPFARPSKLIHITGGIWKSKIIPV